MICLGAAGHETAHLPRLGRVRACVRACVTSPSRQTREKQAHHSQSPLQRAAGAAPPAAPPTRCPACWPRSAWPDNRGRRGPHTRDGDGSMGRCTASVCLCSFRQKGKWLGAIHPPMAAIKSQQSSRAPAKEEEREREQSDRKGKARSGEGTSLQRSGLRQGQGGCGQYSRGRLALLEVSRRPVTWGACEGHIW